MSSFQCTFHFGEQVKVTGLNLVDGKFWALKCAYQLKIGSCWGRCELRYCFDAGLLIFSWTSPVFSGSVVLRAWSGHPSNTFDEPSDPLVPIELWLCKWWQRKQSSLLSLVTCLSLFYPFAMKWVSSNAPIATLFPGNFFPISDPYACVVECTQSSYLIVTVCTFAWVMNTKMLTRINIEIIFIALDWERISKNKYGIGWYTQNLMNVFHAYLILFSLSLCFVSWMLQLEI
jgi:hypothetical protein